MLCVNLFRFISGIIKKKIKKSLDYKGWKILGFTFISTYFRARLHTLSLRSRFNHKIDFFQFYSNAKSSPVCNATVFLYCFRSI